MLFHVNHVDCVELFDDILFEGFFHTMPLLIADSAPLQHWDCIQIRLQQKLDWKKVYIHFMKWILNGKLFFLSRRDYWLTLPTLYDVWLKSCKLSRKLKDTQSKFPMNFIDWCLRRRQNPHDIHTSTTTEKKFLCNHLLNVHTLPNAG